MRTFARRFSIFGEVVVLLAGYVAFFGDNFAAAAALFAVAIYQHILRGSLTP